MDNGDVRKLAISVSYSDFAPQRIWVILDEVNVFTWPGFDLPPIRRGEGRIDYGLLPPKLFDRLIQKFSRLPEEGRVVTSSRDEPASSAR
jgi:hypothetical protein